MRKLNLSCWVVLLSILCTIVCSCSDDDPKTNPINKDLDEYVDVMSQAPQSEEWNDEREIATGNEIYENDYGKYICNTVTYEARPGYSEMMFLDPYKDVLYAGALLNGQSVVDGSYTLCNLKRKPITLTVNLPSEGDISTTIKDPKYSTIQTALKDIFDQGLSSEVPAKVSSTISKVYNKADLKAKLGINCNVHSIFEVGGNINFDYENSYQRVIVSFSQAYFDVVVDQPTSSSDFIDLEAMQLEEVKSRLGDYSPVYISSVTYGRIALFYFESSDLSIDLAADIKLALPINIKGVDVKFEGEAEFNALFESGALTCNAFILGGSADNACQSIANASDFISFIKNDAKLENASKAAPIAYSMRYLSNRKPVKVVLASNYTKTECDEIRNYNYRIDLQDVVCKGKWYQPYWINGPIVLRVAGNKTAEKELLNHQFTNDDGGGMWMKNETRRVIGKEVEHNFGELLLTELDGEYFEWDVSGLWHSHYLSPSSHSSYKQELTKIRLKDLSPGLDTLEVSTGYHKLLFIYNVDVVE